MAKPDKVRVYKRRLHFVLQWWDPAAKGNLCERIDGDLLDALARAREIDRRLAEIRSSGQAPKRLGHPELVSAFLGDLQRRADAGEVSPSTVDRYRAALSHYVAFAATPAALKSCRRAGHVNRDFALAFAAFLKTRRVPPNGHPNAAPRAMKSPELVLDTVRAMYEWAMDPQRGHCLPAGFVNPFRKATLKRRTPAPSVAGEPDITLDMACDFLRACDEWQLAVFAPIVLYGLRASEPAYLFRENIRRGWVEVTCLSELDFTTKGVRDKSLPLLDAIADLWGIGGSTAGSGLLLTRRAGTGARKPGPLVGCSFRDLIGVFEDRCEQAKAKTAVERECIREAVLREAGGLTYDLIHDEFERVARTLHWPAAATLKDLRHLFATAMANGGMPEHERKYLMGHAPGRDAIVTYTHMNRIREHYLAAVEAEYADLITVLKTRLKILRAGS